ncbi:MAG TPA: ATP-binding protein, partial [Myxococcota bacterium]
AHEINTPIQFVSDSIHFIQDSFNDTLPLLTKYRTLRGAVAEGNVPDDMLEAIEEAEDDADLDYVLENLPKAITRSIDGLDRVATLVRSMKEFAHPDQKEKTTADLNRAIETTITIARNEYKYVADLQTDFGDIPSVKCHVSELNQVFLNIIVNAAHAIGDKVKGTDKRGTITVRTFREGDDVVVAISDDGGGIPEAIRARIYEPFFTTKEVGRGTGQGLAISRSVIVEKHGGALQCTSVEGEGTTFFIRLPIAAVDRTRAAA